MIKESLDRQRERKREDFLGKDRKKLRHLQTTTIALRI